MLTAASRLRFERPHRIVIMGVAGCGKSAIGALLADRIGIAYVDGDDLHPAANIEKMSKGIALGDTDRWPWLSSVGAVLGGAEDGIVVGCSALKRCYRDHIRATAQAEVTFVHLSGSLELIGQRMATRPGHFMPVSLLESQFAALEPLASDENALTVDIDGPIDGIVREIAESIENGQA